MPDMRARFARHDKIDPGRIGPRIRRSHYFDLIAIAQQGTHRHQFAVDFHCGAMVADVGMDCVGEIHGGRTARQRKYFSFGREYINFVGKQIDFDMLQKFRRIAAALLDFEQGLQPLMRFLLHVVDIGIAGFIQPVRSDAGLGDFVHFVRADLDFYRCAERAE